MKSCLSKWIIFFLITCLWGGAGHALPEQLTIGYIDEQSFNIDIENADKYESVFLIKQVAQSLVEEDKFGRIAPSIAMFWTISADMKKYTFHLHEGIVFHNGDKVTASDVAFSLNVVRNAKANPIN